jgi:hypothetical protein
MNKIVYSLIMIIMFASCATKKHITSSTTTTDIVSDSATQSKNITEDLQIEWFFDGEETSGITDTSGIPKWLKPILPSADKPPKKGKLRISISKHFSSSSQQTKVKKSVKSKQKEKAKTKERAEKSVKSQNRNWLISSIIIIIFGFLVKYVLEHKNNLKKTWRKVKKYLTLHHPNEHRGNAEERPSERH